jgi:hypothetical protein
MALNASSLYKIGASPRDGRIARARDLACEIEALLMPCNGGDDYAVRLAQAMTRNLIDQLAEIDRPPRSGSRLNYGT